MMMIREYEIIFFTNQEKEEKKQTNKMMKQKLQIYFLTNCKEKENIMKNENFNKKNYYKLKLILIEIDST